MQHQPSPPDEQTPESSTLDSSSSQPPQSTRPSRRQVIAGAGAGIGLAASGAVAGVAGSAVLASRSGGGHATTDGSSADVVVAHVVDAGTGDIDVYVGESQTRIRDKAVAARLSSAR